MFWKRSVLNDGETKAVGAALQQVLVDFIALSLQGKQAHWNLHGPKFLSVHEKLDEVVAFARKASDEVAERMDQVGVAPDGRVKTVAETSRLEAYPPGFIPDDRTVSLVADRLHGVATSVREAIKKVAEVDPVTEDLLTGLATELEKQLWMFQAVEKGH